MNTSPDMPSSRPMTLRQQVGERGALRVQIEQCFVGHNFPNTEIVLRIESLCHEIAREARLAGKQEIIAIGRERLDNDETYSLDAFIEDAEVYLDKLTQKPEEA